MGFCGGLRFFLPLPAETETVSEGSCRKLCAVLQKIYGPFGASLCTSCDVDRRQCFLLLLWRLGKPLKLLLSSFAEFEDFSFYVPPTQRRVPNVFFWLDGRRSNLEDSRFCPCAAFCRWNDFVLTWGENPAANDFFSLASRLLVVVTRGVVVIGFPKVVCLCELEIDSYIVDFPGRRPFYLGGSKFPGILVRFFRELEKVGAGWVTWFRVFTAGRLQWMGEHVKWIGFYGLFILVFLLLNLAYFWNTDNV